MADTGNEEKLGSCTKCIRKFISFLKVSWNLFHYGSDSLSIIYKILLLLNCLTIGFYTSSAHLGSCSPNDFCSDEGWHWEDRNTYSTDDDNISPLNNKAIFPVLQCNTQNCSTVCTGECATDPRIHVEDLLFRCSTGACNVTFGPYYFGVQFLSVAALIGEVLLITYLTYHAYKDGFSLMKEKRMPKTTFMTYCYFRNPAYSFYYLYKWRDFLSLADIEFIFSPSRGYWFALVKIFMVDGPYITASLLSNLISANGLTVFISVASTINLAATFLFEYSLQCAKDLKKGPLRRPLQDQEATRSLVHFVAHNEEQQQTAAEESREEGIEEREGEKNRQFTAVTC